MITKGVKLRRNGKNFSGGKFPGRRQILEPRLEKVKWKLLVPEAPNSELVGDKIQTAKPYVKVPSQNSRRRIRLKELGGRTEQESQY